MLIHTAIFGPMEIPEQDIFLVNEGLPGFDGIYRYALISQQEDDVTLYWFQAVDAALPCFVVFDPFEMVEGYAPEIAKADMEALACENIADLLFYVIAVVPDDISKTTVNLKSPIVLNRRNQTGRQIILANRDYPIRFSLTAEQSGS